MFAFALNVFDYLSIRVDVLLGNGILCLLTSNEVDGLSLSCYFLPTSEEKVLLLGDFSFLSMSACIFQVKS